MRCTITLIGFSSINRLCLVDRVEICWYFRIFVKKTAISESALFFVLCVLCVWGLVGVAEILECRTRLAHARSLVCCKRSLV